MGITELVSNLQARKAEGKFTDATVESIWSEFLEPVFRLLGWEQAEPKGLNTIDPFLELGSVARIAVAGGRVRSSRGRSRAEVFLEISPDTRISVITNFDEWEVLFKRETIAEFRAEEFVSPDARTESEAWHKLVRLIGREAIEDRGYLHLANQLYQQRVDEQEIEVYVRELNELRKMIGDFLIKNPKEISSIKRSKAVRTAYEIMGITGKKPDRERDETTLNQIIQRLIDRFIIFRFAEDNNILVDGNPKPLSDLYYRQLLDKPSEVLAKQDTVWRMIAGRKDAGMAGLFGEFAITYNGGVFEPLEGAHPDRVNELPLNDELVRRIVDLIVKRPVKKKLARLLGYIYEKYIGQRLYIFGNASDQERLAEAAGLTTTQARSLTQRLKDEGRPFVQLANTPEKKKQAIYYTPEDVTQYISRQTVGVMLDELYEDLEKAKTVSGSVGAAGLLALFEKARSLTVLDPTCGSGAFLIEALALVRQFYRALARAMAEHLGVKHLEESDAEIRRRAYSSDLLNFGEALVSLKAPGVFALNWNIYGVDIDPRAVEICSVSLMIQVIEELVRPQTGEVVSFPSIMGENIKRGNSLVSPVKRRKDKTDWEILSVKSRGDLVKLAMLRSNLRNTAEEPEKDGVRQQIEQLTRKLYSKLPDWLPDQWRPQAFCWQIEFPEVFANASGFAAVIGNPPYLEVRGEEYAGLGLRTQTSRDLYVYILEVGTSLLRSSGRLGMIVKLGLVATDRMQNARSLLLERCSELRISTFECRPQHLIRDADIRHSIVILVKKESSEQQWSYHSTRLVRWYASQREGLLDRLRYVDATDFCSADNFPKVGSEIELSILRKMYKARKTIADYEGPSSKSYFFYHRNVRYWMKVLNHQSYYRLGQQTPSRSPESKLILLAKGLRPEVFVALLSSNLFYWFQALYSEMRHVPRSVVTRLPFDYEALTKVQREKLVALCRELMKDYKTNAFRRVTSNARVGRLEYDEYYPWKSREIIERIDDVLAKHYCLTPEELRFLKTYDIEFRIGASAEPEVSDDDEAK